MKRRARASADRRHICAGLGRVHGEGLYHRGLRTHVRDDERRKRIDMLYLTATSDERAYVEAREHRVAVHRAEWEIHGCEDEIGRVYGELQEEGR